MDCIDAYMPHILTGRQLSIRRHRLATSGAQQLLDSFASRGDEQACAATVADVGNVCAVRNRFSSGAWA